ncbi:MULTISPECIES: hypothetical protein [unclassified Thiocapsa]|uniref:hypothetical protein n=1 Tax=unclassified Thiocapsa TaxID=2641286 RepID=UPI0035AE5A74
MSRKDIARPPVHCPECRFFVQGERLCRVARKVFITTRSTTCKKYQAVNRPEPAPPVSNGRHWEVSELWSALTFEELDAAVSEITVDASGSVWVRYACGAAIEDMRAVGRVIIGS